MHFFFFFGQYNGVNENLNEKWNYTLLKWKVKN